jgi:hypothetical protein
MGKQIEGRRQENMSQILVAHRAITNYQLPITNYQLPITNYQLPTTNYQLPTTNYQLPSSAVKIQLIYRSPCRLL